MRRFLAALISLAIVFMFINLLSNLPEYGKIDIEKRVSKAFIDKNVKGEKEEIKFKESKDLEDGSANVVTSVVVNYRGFDTLGEVTVLFTASLGVGIVLAGMKRRKFGREANFILKIASGIILPFIFLFGVYVFVHGHLTPGGGFPGGTIIAAGILLLYLSNEEFDLKKGAKALESTMGSVYVILGLIGLVVMGIFLMNFLPTGVIGNLVSAGFVPIIYVVIGFKVGAELSGIVSELNREG